MKPSDQARRLHPLTLVQRLIVSLPGLVFILLPLFKESDGTAWFNLIFAGLYALFVLPWIAVYYLRFRYWITPTELIIHSGVVN
jgi:putative membrane protein